MMNKITNKSGSMLRKILALSSLSCMLSLMHVGHSLALSFSDSFEGGTIDPFWTVSADYGSVSLSTNQAHSGSQSIKLSSTSGGQRNVYLTHDFSEAMIGTASVWFYDGYPGQQTLYSHFSLTNATTPVTGAGFGIQDWDPTYYHASTGSVPTPNEGQTSSARSLGWHYFEAYLGQDKVEASIDGVVVSSSSTASQGITSIFYSLTGPVWRPNAEFYFDDFQANLTPLAAIPEPETYAMMLAGLGLMGFVARRRKQKEAAAA